MIRFACAAVLVLAALPSVSAVEYNYGETWGTRDPVVCGPFSVDQIPPAELNAVLATSIYQCALEADPVGGESYLNLVEDIQLRLARPRAFGTSTDEYSIQDIDPEGPIYPFRVTQTSVRCHFISDVLENEGKNCRETPSGGEGMCYTTLFGDWVCHAYVAATGETKQDMPPRT